jgi:hypothetical protein
VSGISIRIEITSSIIRRMSAFCDGGRGGVEAEKDRDEERSRASAKVKRMGRMVNVYRNESRQRMNPKPIICGQLRDLLRCTG